MLTEIRFYEQILGDAKRTIYCQPSVTAAVRDAVEAHSAGHLFTVRSTPVCPEGKLILVDEQALEASFNATVQRGMRDRLFP
jgi:hypothetical protein